MAKHKVKKPARDTVGETVEAMRKAARDDYVDALRDGRKQRSTVIDGKRVEDRVNWREDW